MNRGGVFVTGTDTGVGKTLVAAGLVRALQYKGVRVAAVKPVAAGCERTVEGLRNADAEQLRSLFNPPPPYGSVNPCALEAAAAPHLVAEEEGRTIPVADLAQHLRRLAGEYFTLVEGAGGWRVPLAPGLDVACLARESGLPVVLVVGIRLGCLNHAQLSAEAILRDGVALVGWIASEVEPDDPRSAAQIATLERLLPVPLVGRVGYMDRPDAESVASCLHPPEQWLPPFCEDPVSGEA